MGIFGDLIMQAMGGFPTKPSVPAAPNVNPQAAQSQSITGNQAALPGLEDLASATNQFNMNQRQQLLGQAIPNYRGLTGGASNTLSDWLSGNLSPDVASAVRRNANARSFAGGYGGSGMADALQARDLGLTSLDLQKMGVSALPGYLGTTAQIGMPRQFDPAAGFISPMEQIAASQWNETNRYGRDWLQNQLDSLPDPGQAAIAKDVGGIGDVVGTALLSYLGGGLGGVGGAAMGAQMGGAGGGGAGGFSLGPWLQGLGGGGAGGGMFDAISGMGVG